MKDFIQQFNELNAEQRDAVTTLDGPLLVIAGPGTGKTQLLSMRIGNILQNTDTDPTEVLCLTFTESGAQAMQLRLISLIGEAAYRVPVFTFHSFANYLISNYPERFIDSQLVHPIDEIRQFEILNQLLEELPHDNPLSIKRDDEYMYLRALIDTISSIKKSGRSYNEIITLADSNTTFMDFVEPLVTDVFAGTRISKSILPDVQKLHDDIQNVPENETAISLKRLLLEDLAHALESGETKPVTAWKNRWFAKSDDAFIFKDRLRQEKLLFALDVYESYNKKLKEAWLYDYDDMILEVIRALEEDDQFRAEIQERYQHFLVDEFQDTNDAQVKLLRQLIESPVHENKPNLMIVGDDDQAIYKFQGAESSYLRDFMANFTGTKVVTLKQNYRSTPSILHLARKVIVNGENRLEDQWDEIDKELISNKPETKTPEHHVFKTRPAQLTWVSKAAKQALDAGEEVAIIARKHKHLKSLLPYLYLNETPLRYERRDNILEQEHIAALIQCARTVELCAQGPSRELDAALVHMLSLEFLAIPPQLIWELTKQANAKQESWLDIMLTHDEERLATLAHWLLALSKRSKTHPVEYIIDVLIGNQDIELSLPSKSIAYTSPFKAFYFSEESLEKQSESYIRLLSGLRVLHSHAREWSRQDINTLSAFLEYINLHDAHNIPIADTSLYRESSDAVHLLTAHRAKGLEFDRVFILDTHDDVWGAKARSAPARLAFPANMPYAPAGDTYDDKLRLFYVSLTRARKHLHLLSYEQTVSNQQTVPLEFIHNMNDKVLKHTTHYDDTPVVEELEYDWMSRHVSHSRINRDSLLPYLENYKLSATHLNNFLDVTNGGPKNWLTNNLLRFPQSMSPTAMYGSAVHETLHEWLLEWRRNDQKPSDSHLLELYQDQLSRFPLVASDYNLFLKKGCDFISMFINSSYNDIDITDRPEVDFSNQHVIVNEAHLTGKIDRLRQVDKKQVIVADYKTGKQALAWKGSGTFEQVKLHKYRQQLLFYKLLVEHSRDFGSFMVKQGQIDFIEADPKTNTTSLVLDYDDGELERFKKLIQAVWVCMKQGQIPSTSKFKDDITGIQDFENELLAGTYS